MEAKVPYRIDPTSELSMPADGASALLVRQLTGVASNAFQHPDHSRSLKMHQMRSVRPCEWPRHQSALGVPEYYYSSTSIGNCPFGP